MSSSFNKDEQEVLAEIFGSDESVSYISVAKKIAEVEELLEGNSRFFWRRTKLTAIDTAEKRATLRILRGIAKQIEEEMFDSNGDLKATAHWVRYESKD